MARGGSARDEERVRSGIEPVHDWEAAKAELTEAGG